MLERYRRLLYEQQWDAEALCFTYAQGLDEAAMITAFGGDPAAMMPQAELFETVGRFHYSKVPGALLVADLGGWCRGVEPNGFQGSRPEVLRRAAAGGVAVSVFWNINASNSFRYGFDMHAPQERYGPDPHLLDGQMAGLPFGDDLVQSYAAELALAERVTGIRRLPGPACRRGLRGHRGAGRPGGHRGVPGRGPDGGPA